MKCSQNTKVQAFRVEHQLKGAGLFVSDTNDCKGFQNTRLVLYFERIVAAVKDNSFLQSEQDHDMRPTHHMHHKLR